MVHMEEQMINSTLLYKIYNRARQSAQQTKPTRTHYNANTFG